VETRELEAHSTREVSLEGGDLPLRRGKQVFTHEDGSVGSRYLVSSAHPLSFADLTTSSHERGQGEWSHPALPQNVALAKAPTQTVPTQPHPFFAALGGFIKGERLKMRTKLTQFALKSQLSLKALRSAFATLRTLPPRTGLRVR
jgi:hypothetical protein